MNNIFRDSAKHGLDWTGLDNWTGLECWTGLDWTDFFFCNVFCKFLLYLPPRIISLITGVKSYLRGLPPENLQFIINGNCFERLLFVERQIVFVFVPQKTIHNSVNIFS